jgi:nucleotide-binding universal stress UspA family protein
VAPLRTVGVGFDRGPEGWNALQRAAQLAAAAGAQLRIMLVLEPLTAFPATAALTDELAVDRRSLAEIELRRAAESVSQRLRPETRLLRGDPIGRLDIEAHDVDLLVLGSRDYGPVRRVLLGSVSTALVRSAASPVMVVPRSVEFAPEGEGMAAEDELLRADIGR